MGSSKKQTIGYRYLFGIHMGIGRGPVDALNEIKVGDRRAWIGSETANTSIYIDQYDLFGGEEKEGGIQGNLEVMMGEPNQVASSGLVAMRGPLIPGFRKVFTVFYNGIVCMNNPYPKTWKFRLNRTLKGWDGPVFYPEKARIGSTYVSGSPSRKVLEMPLTDDFDTGPFSDGQPLLTGSNSGTFNGISLQLTPGETFIASPLKNGSAYVFGAGYEAATISVSVQINNLIIDPEESQVLATLLEVIYRINNVSTFTYKLGIENVEGAPALVAYEIDGRFLSVITSDIPINARFTIEVNNETGLIRYLQDDVVIASTVLLPGNLVTAFVSSDALIARNLFELTSFNVSDLKVFIDSTVVYSGFFAMNGAHIIYECLTNRDWGRGLDSSKLDIESFRAAADRLYDEQFGLCMKWTRTDAIQNFVQQVLDHLGAALYQSRLTGLMVLKLIRDDYNPDLLPVLDTDSGLLEIRDVVTGISGRSINSVTVTWHDPLEDEDRTVMVKNNAAIQMNGGSVNSTSKTYAGIPTERLARRIAQRDLRASSTELRRFTLVTNRSERVFQPADVFCIQDTKRGIPKTVVRVGKVKDGTLVDGKITLEVVQDVFALPDVSFASGVPSTWVPPNNQPCIAQQKVIEAPYFLLAGRLTAAELDYMKDDGAYVATMVAKGQPMNIAASIAVRDSAAEPDDIPPDGSFVCG